MSVDVKGLCCDLCVFALVVLFCCSILSCVRFLLSSFSRPVGEFVCGVKSYGLGRVQSIWAVEFLSVIQV